MCPSVLKTTILNGVQKINCKAGRSQKTFKTVQQQKCREKLRYVFKSKDPCSNNACLSLA